MKFKIGDKVILNPNLEIGKRYGDEWFSYSMKELKGKIFTIEKIVKGKYQVQENAYYYSEEMLIAIQEYKSYRKRKLGIL